jgi:hypothetical protein
MWTPPNLEKFREVCLCSRWLERDLPDYDFWHLLEGLKHHDPGGGHWLDFRVLSELINWHDEYGDLWR